MSFEFKIEIKDCKDCPHVKWFSYGPDCDLNNGQWPIVLNKGNGISDKCPYRTKQIGNKSIKH